MTLRPAWLFVLAMTLLADEGQWLPTQIRDFDWPALQKRGMTLSRDQFWHPEQGGVLSATVQINGCTASFVSKDGLLVTNHHCGFDAVAHLSTPEQNWLRDGFAAQEAVDELPAPGMEAYVLKRIEDVTAKVHAAQDKAKNNYERWDLTQRTTAQLVDEAQKKEPGTVCNVASFLEGKEYHLYFRTRLTDVRLVYAPPRAIGEFGGEVDNWEWPRHTGDFTFFRAYVAPDGTPRPHQAENVPYQPKHFLKTATAGMHEGDLAIVMGYPGNTQRYRTSRAVATRQGYVYPHRAALLQQVIAVLEQAGKQSEQKALEVAARIKQLANVEKNARGMIFGLDRNATVEKKLADEQALAAWVAADPERQKRFGGALQEQLAMDEEEAATIQKDTTLGFAVNAFLGEVPLLSALMDASASSLANREGRVAKARLEELADPALTADLESIQAPVFAVMLAELRALPEGSRIRGWETLPGGDGPDAGKAMLQGSAMADAKARRELFEQGRDAIQTSADPLVVLARGLAVERSDLQRRMRERTGRALQVGRRWLDAQEAFRGKQFYPDANGTLRVSIASVKGYSPRDGVLNTPHTTVLGLLKKEAGREPFANPPALLEAARTRQQSRWFDKAIGDVPVCFLCDGDTTGGNSGSPVVNGRGELVGLNFDRVFEAVAGDFGWSAERSRNVVCDVRYVLWVVESVQPCARLLKELGV